MKTAAAIGVLIILVLGSLIATGALNLETFPQFLLATVILAVIAYFARLLAADMSMRTQTPHHRLYPAFHHHLRLLGGMVPGVHRGHRIF